MAEMTKLGRGQEKAQIPAILRIWRQLSLTTALGTTTFQIQGAGTKKQFLDTSTETVTTKLSIFLPNKTEKKNPSCLPYPLPYFHIKNVGIRLVEEEEQGLWPQ